MLEIRRSDIQHPERIALYLGYPIAMALVDAGSVAIGDKVEADVSGRRVEAEVVQLPFYKRAK